MMFPSLLEAILESKLQMILTVVVDECGIKNKITFVITDNASNMKAAFKAKFPTNQEDTEGEKQDDDPLDDEEMWHDFSEEE